MISSLNRGPRRRPSPVPLPPGMADPQLSLADLPMPVRWADLFGRRGPVEVEIGTGKGNTLVRLAREHPETDFLGVELGTKWARVTRGRLVQAGVHNARLVSGEAQWVLGRYVPPGSVRRFHIYFPDPWPKKRHGKRRLFRPGFPALLQRCLSADGEVRVVTDHETYLAQILEVMEQGRFELLPAAAWPDDPVSAFERKYRDQGRTIHRRAFRPPAG